MTLFMTIIAAIVLMVLVCIFLFIGKLITGKNKLTRGCGKIPGEKTDKKNCSLCGKDNRCDQDDERDLPKDSK